MVKIEFEIPDDILADFYKAQGANPDSSWTPEEAAQWQEVEYLEPFILGAIFGQVKSYRLNKEIEKAHAKAQEGNSLLDKKVEEMREASRDKLPESVRPPEPIIDETPIVDVEPIGTGIDAADK